MPFGALVVALVVLRGLGGLGVNRFATWRGSATHALVVLLLVTATAHFVPPSVTVMPTQADLVAMVPPLVPFPELAVYATGMLEIIGALGLVVERTRRWAGLCLAVLFVALFPANIVAALDPAQADATPLWIRTPEQVIYIGIALWAAGLPRLRGRRSDSTAESRVPA